MATINEILINIKPKSAPGQETWKPFMLSMYISMHSIKTFKKPS